MGKSDKIQAKLQFESRKAHKMRSEGASAPAEMLENGEWETAPDLQQILMAMQECLTKIDGKIDALTYRMDCMSDRLDGHAECLDQVERRV
ncbi:hypothetical protein NDU88_011288 [Pleurodeles waltl]|uniref:Uncharacterized protein n=1 Tax=Pleurodeles waltl TaxID=8319 RepID=A0AAV7QWT4_PLEWA|nr:hypothetical protein NDU88_011288 [Pleurodeles waltl]